MNDQLKSVVLLVSAFFVAFAVCVGAMLWRRKRKKECETRGFHDVNLGGVCRHCGWDMFYG